MNEPVEFVKLSGSGNDFICIDNRDRRFDELLASDERRAGLVRVLCRRGLAVGADGVIFATQNEVEGFADIAARFFEPDGSEAELCGNGTGCFVHWVTDNGWVPQREIKILTPAGVVRGQNATGRYVRVCIPSPEDIETDLEVCAAGKTWRCDYAVTGVPHLVVYVDDVEAVDVHHLGAAFRHHKRFLPRGVNANFVQVLADGEIAVRTFEFGVEAETLACGTGSAAAAILAAQRFGWPGRVGSAKSPVLVDARSGDTLKVTFACQADGRIDDVCLETVVRFIYRGTLHPDLIAQESDDSR